MSFFRRILQNQSGVPVTSVALLRHSHRKSSPPRAPRGKMPFVKFKFKDTNNPPDQEGIVKPNKVRHTVEIKLPKSMGISSACASDAPARLPEEPPPPRPPPPPRLTPTQQRKRSPSPPPVVRYNPSVASSPPPSLPPPSPPPPQVPSVVPAAASTAASTGLTIASSSFKQHHDEEDKEQADEDTAEQLANEAAPKPVSPIKADAPKATSPAPRFEKKSTASAMPLMKSAVIRTTSIDHPDLAMLNVGGGGSSGGGGNRRGKADGDAYGEHHDTDEEEAAKSWRNMKLGLLSMGVAAICSGSYLYLVLGSPKYDQDGKLIMDEFSEQSVLKQYYSRMMKELKYYEKLIKEPSRDKLLPDVVAPPYYQPPYTLVLELTDVLVHPEWSYLTGWRFKKRPGIDNFLESLAGHFEIVIYTAEMGMTVFPIIEALDPKNLISYKLVRDATHFDNGDHVKNLDKLNRDLSKVVVVDWNENSTKFHQSNVFRIQRWGGDDNDDTLSDLAAFLRTLAEWEVEDVRDVLKYYSSYGEPLELFRQRRRQFFEYEED